LAPGPNIDSRGLRQRQSRIETDGIAARTENGDNGEAKEIVRRFERALSEGKSLDQAQHIPGNVIRVSLAILAVVKFYRRRKKTDWHQRDNFSIKRIITDWEF